MELISSWQEALSVSWSQVISSSLAILPSLLGAVVVFTLGLVIAYWARRLVTELLRLAKAEEFSKAVGISKYLAKAEFKLTLGEVVGIVVEWLVILIFFLAVVDILGLSMVSQVLLGVVKYIPNVIAAALIFAAGYLLAGLVESLVKGALASIDHDVAGPVSKLARWVIVLIAFFAAVDQLQVAKGLIATFFQGLTYTIVLAVGLSLGLGAKDLVSQILKDWYQKIKK